MHQIGCGCCSHPFPGKKHMLYQKPGTINASMSSIFKRLSPAYRLLVGVSGRSNAFAIAERLGLSRRHYWARSRKLGEEIARRVDGCVPREDSSTSGNGTGRGAKLRSDAAKSRSGAAASNSTSSVSLLEKAERDTPQKPMSSSSLKPDGGKSLTCASAEEARQGERITAWWKPNGV